MTGNGADLAAAKQLVWADPWAALDEDVELWGPAPIGRLLGREEVDARLLGPLVAAIPGGVWRPYVFLGGRWDGEIWVASTGELVGPMTASWCGIPPPDDRPGGEVRLRYGLFHRVERGAVVEIRCLLDVLGLAAQAGHDLLPPFPGRSEPVPGPALDNGLVVEPQDPAETAATLRLVEDMLGGCNRLVDGELASMGMEAYWHDDMRWYGPWGIGWTHGFREFQDDAQGPSVASFPNRRGGFHRARIADGVTAAFNGWPSLRGHFDGVAFRGIEPTGGPIGQNIMDFYVRRGDRLHENWVLIDLIDFAAQCGVDLLAPLRERA